MAYTSELEVYFGNRFFIDRLKHKDCYQRIWSSYIRNEEIDIDSCNVCRSSFSIDYNCLTFALEQSIDKRLYNKGRQLIEEFIAANKHHEEYMELVIDGLRDKLKILVLMENYRSTSDGKVKDSFPIYEFESFIVLNNKKVNFLIDTGASFSTLKNKAFVTGREIELIDYAGNSHSKPFGYVKSKNNVKIFSYFNTSLNSLGLNYLTRFESIEFKFEKMVSNDFITTQMFKDSANLFVDGDIIFNGKAYSMRNICLDTGAKQTAFMPKFYRDIRPQLAENEVLTFKGNGIAGSFERLGKLVRSIEMEINGNKFASIKEAPIFFKSNVSTVCDVILGQDILRGRLKKIDFQKREISFAVKNTYDRFRNREQQ